MKTLYYFDENSLTYRIYRKPFPINQVFNLFLIMFIGILSIRIAHDAAQAPIIKYEKVYQKPETDTLHYKTVLAYIEQLNIQYPDVVIAQCILESGNFKSQLAKENNNILGLKAAKQRPTTSKGEFNKYACYDSWKDCVRDYAIWQGTYKRNFVNREQYLNYLQSVWAEDTKYKEKLKRILNDQRI